MKTYFYLVLNNRTFKSEYRHDAFYDAKDIQKSLGEDEKLISVWEVKGKVEF